MFFSSFLDDCSKTSSSIVFRMSLGVDCNSHSESKKIAFIHVLILSIMDLPLVCVLFPLRWWIRFLMIMVIESRRLQLYHCCTFVSWNLSMSLRLGALFLVVSVVRFGLSLSHAWQVIFCYLRNLPYASSSCLGVQFWTPNLACKRAVRAWASVCKPATPSPTLFAQEDMNYATTKLKLEDCRINKLEINNYHHATQIRDLAPLARAPWIHSNLYYNMLGEEHEGWSDIHGPDLISSFMAESS